MTVDYSAFRTKKRARRVSAVTGKMTALSEELELQIQCFVRYDKQCRMDRKLRENTRLFAINPLPGKTQRTAGLSKRAGLRAGVWDAIFHDLRSDEPLEIWIEFKAGNGGLSAAQEGWFEWIDKMRFQAHECRSISEFERIVGL